MYIELETDIESSWEILYWTDENNLTNTVSTVSWTGHTKTITWLSENTKYYYKVRWINSWYNWNLSDVKVFRTAGEFDMDSFWWDFISTGSIILWGTNFTATWATFSFTWSLDIKNEYSQSEVSLNLEDLIISSDGWDGVFNPPEQVSFSWSFTDTRYTLESSLTFDIWSKDSELVLSWQVADVSLEFGTSYDWQILWIFRSSDNWVTYEYLEDCLVANWLCDFSTDKFSLFAAAAPSDDVPDAFSFTDVTSSAISTENISNTITISWLNTSSAVSIVWGSYSINWWSYTTVNWTISEWETIVVKTDSSSSYSTQVDVVLTIWWVSDTYSITTQSAPASSWWWWGGWWWASYPVCQAKWLECRAVAWSQTLFKWYKRSGFTCTWWNLWQVCDASSVVEEVEVVDIKIEKKLEPVKYLENNIDIKIPILKKIYTDKKKELLNIDESLSKISYLGDDINNLKYQYRIKYSNWLDALQSTNDYLLEKNKDSSIKEFKKFLSLHTDLKKYNDKYKIRVMDVWWEELNYIKYKNKKIQKIQILLFWKIKRKEPNTYVYRLAGRVVHNLNTLLTNKKLTKSDIKEIRENTISIYKDFIKEYAKLKEKKSLAEKLKNHFLK